MVFLNKSSLGCAVLVAVYTPFSAALWPSPASFSEGKTTRSLSPDFRIESCSSLSKYQHDDPSTGVDAAIQRAMDHIQQDNFSPIVINKVDDNDDNHATDFVSPLSKLSVCSVSDRSSCEQQNDQDSYSVTKQVNSILEDRDESYTLIIPDNDHEQATLTACSSLGLLRGLQSFTQLVYSQQGKLLDKRDLGLHVYDSAYWGSEVRTSYDPSSSSSSSSKYIANTPIHITDEPAFPIRGFHLDTSRNYFSVESIKKLIEAASWTKFNQFHWHVVDAQSWPIEISTHPELMKAGAYSPQKVYTKDVVSDIISFANARGIDVLVEFDVPGHTSIIHEVEESYIACFNEKNWSRYAAEPPSGQIRIADDNAVNYVLSIFDELTKMFPSKYISTGGDEINLNCYQDDEPTQNALKEKGIDFNTSFTDFTAKTHGLLRDNGKIPLVWDELVQDFDVNLGKDAIVTVWRTADFVKSIVGKGYKVLHAASEYFYLDCGHGQWLGNSPDTNSWCDPFKSWQRMYSFDPYANLTSEESKLIIGGETLLWAEQTDDTNLEEIYWPRAAATAEVFWTGATINDKARNLNEALPRITDLRYRMVNRGIRAVPLQPEWCAVRPGECDLV